MKRIIIDYKKLTPEMAGMRLEQYPEGYGDEDLISFKSPKGDWIEAVELQTTEALYLVKISKSLASFLASLDELDTLPDVEDPIQDDKKEYDGSLETETSLDE